MHAKKFILLMILLAFVITCFVASPVFSGNGSNDGYPWDADDTGTHDGSNDGGTDTTTSQVVMTFNSTGTDGASIIDGIASQILFSIFNSFDFYHPEIFYVVNQTEGSNSEQLAVTNKSAK